LEFDAKFKELTALSERSRVYRVLTGDRRDFDAIRVGPHFSRALEIVP